MNAHFLWKKEEVGSISVFFLVLCACIWSVWIFPLGWKEKQKKERERQIPTPMTSAMLICVNFLDVLSPNSVYLSVQSISKHCHLEMYSKIIVYQGCKISKSLWIFLCVKSVWSQDRRGAKPTRFCASLDTVFHSQEILLSKMQTPVFLDEDGATIAASGHDEFWFHISFDIRLPHRVLKV